MTDRADDHTRLAHHLREPMRVMYGAETAKSVNTTLFTSITLDHKRYARASLNFRGRQRYGAVAYGSYEGENQHDLGKTRSAFAYVGGE
jgi:hypothetical protein